MENLIQIRAYDNYIYAHIALAKLQNAGITCFLKDEYTITIDPLLSPMLGGIKLMVPERQVEQAQELLAEPEGEPGGEDEE
ncbi:MAG TPA: DUF2007 domain-containing protein [Puia sp.]|nr:DUF2007 domain-containing protein [Puia sp.]